MSVCFSGGDYRLLVVIVCHCTCTLSDTAPSVRHAVAKALHARFRLPLFSHFALFSQYTSLTHIRPPWPLWPVTIRSEREAMFKMWCDEIIKKKQSPIIKCKMRLPPPPMFIILYQTICFVFSTKCFTFDGWLMILSMLPLGFLAVAAIDKVQPPTKVSPKRYLETLLLNVSIILRWFHVSYS